MTLWLRVRAPFAAFRWLQAGVYRATSPVIPPSAAWGLLLNLAHVETRSGEDRATTAIRADAPSLRIAVGAVGEAGVSSIYQQLHSYLVGSSSGTDLKKRVYGGKYWISPVRRELLVGFDAVLGVQSPDRSLEDRMLAGLRGELDVERYGLPFAGDNNLLIDRIEAVDEPPAASWYEAMAHDSPPRAGSCRLTVAIDRRDSAQTTTRLYAPTMPSTKPPEAAWTWVPRAPKEDAA